MHIERHVVLVAPEIHWNTGNIGRTCLGTKTTLHLIQPLGFSLDSREVKRAGLDYWPQVDLKLWEHFSQFQNEMKPASGELLIFSKNARKAFWEMPCLPRMFLVFGSETKGLPESILSDFASLSFHIPISDEIRSLNLSTSVGIVLYESLRAYHGQHAWK
jgi:tRNA (cytidine/uridine-2'-O-)-methyltransferase